MDERRRYYFHGDAYEADTSLHYCIGCDLFQPAEHFADCAFTKYAPRRRVDYDTKQHYRWRQSVRVWKRLSRTMHATHRVVDDPLNLFVGRVYRGDPPGPR